MKKLPNYFSFHSLLLFLLAPPADAQSSPLNTHIAAGGAHALALKSDGTIAAWGANLVGQSTPATGFNGVVAVSAGNAHNLALRGEGKVLGWGSNWAGVSTVPTGLTDVVTIDAGGLNNLAFKSTSNGL